MTATSRLDRIADEMDRATNSDARKWPAPMDPAAYHGIAGELVRMIEPHTEADPAALLIQFIVAVGSAIGRGPHYLVESDQHHPNLFAVLVGDSAKARKGTSAGRIRGIFEAITNADGTPDPWARECWQSGLSSGEGLIHAVRDGMGDDHGVIDKRLYVAESEFAGLLRVMTRDGNIISRIVRDAWDRGDLGVMTKSCPTRATGAHISILGHITTDELTRYLDRTESCNGFANRFMFVCVTRSKYLPHGGSLDDADLMPFARRLSGIIETAREIGRVRMSEEAAARWEAVYPALSDAKPGLFGAVTARGEAQVIRLALVYALLDQSPEIRAEHLRAALAVWAYAEASAAFIFGQSLGVPVADSLLKVVDEAGPSGMSRTQMRDHFRRHRNKDEIDRALEMLATQERIYMRTAKTGGRPVEIWTATRWKVVV
jgi:hypothetical protein